MWTLLARPMSREPERVSLQTAFEQSDLPLFGLWLRYVGLGGTAPVGDLQAHISGIAVLDTVQHDMLVQALNERFMERELNHPVPYVRP
jgi:hypothetical protein